MAPDQHVHERFEGADADETPRGVHKHRVPFYSPATRATGHGGGEGRYVLEREAPGELTIANMFFRTKLMENGPVSTTRSVKNERGSDDELDG